MRPVLRIGLFLAAVILFSANTWSQASQICSDTGGATVWLTSRVVYGLVKMTGVEKAERFPKVVVVMTSGARTVASYVIDKPTGGSYCFRDVDGSGATLTLEVEGREVGREVLEIVPANGPKQFRRDFEIEIGNFSPKAKPAVVSAKYQYPRNDKQAKLYTDANAAISGKDFDTAERSLKKIVDSDKGDYWAWAKLGSVYLERNDFAAAESAFRASLQANPDFVPAAINLGRVYLLGQKNDQAVEVLLTATKTDPKAARAFQLLGEAYIVARKEAPGIEALNQAILLEPVPMAESHLLLAWVYDRAGNKKFASREYKLFLQKVPNHPEAKKFEKYIQDNPAEP